MKRIFLLAACLWFGLLSKDCKAQLYAENQTQKPVWFAVAYHESTRDGETTWISESWRHIAPGEKIEVSHIGYDSEIGWRHNFFYYAYQDAPNGRQWRGPRKFVLDSVAPNLAQKDKFENAVYDAHKRQVLARKASYKWYLFKNGIVGEDGQVHTFVLRESDPDVDFTKYKENSVK